MRYTIELLHSVNRLCCFSSKTNNLPVILSKNIHYFNVLYKFVPDKSRLPVLNENDLEEQFVQGSGPGGQNVNRLQNCVVLKHIPTGLFFKFNLPIFYFSLLGIVVKCHQERLLQLNRKIARKLLLTRLDQHQNGEYSLTEQKKRYILARKEYRDQRAHELRLKKKQYKQSFQKYQNSEDSEE